MKTAISIHNDLFDGAERLARRTRRSRSRIFTDALREYLVRHAPDKVTVVQAWDNCGGVGKAEVGITVSSIHLPPPSFVYVAQSMQGYVEGYIANPQSGELTSNGQGPVWAHWGPNAIASDSGGYRLYVANQGSFDVSAYFINRSNGHLTEA
jgi:hypothetical protein